MARGSISGTARRVAVGVSLAAAVALPSVATPAAASTGITIDDPQVLEGNSGVKSLVFTVTSPTTAATVNYAVDGGTANDGGTGVGSNDYDPPTAGRTGIISFSTGTTQTVTVRVNGDEVEEADEQLTVTLSGATGASLSKSLGTGRILNDDHVTLSITGPDAVSEGRSNPLVDNTVAVTVTADKDHQLPITFDYRTVDGTATADRSTIDTRDYSGISGTTTLNAGTNSESYTITVRDDLVAEGDETFSLAVEPARHTAPPDKVITIVDNEVGSYTSLSVRDASAAEGHSGTTPLAFTVESAVPATSAITVTCEPSDGTATGGPTAVAGVDYNNTPVTATIATGSTSTVCNIPIFGDTTAEANETLTLAISSPTPGVGIDRARAAGTILNDDGAPANVFQVDDASITEGSSGTKNLVFTVRRVNPGALPASVAFATADGSAVQPDDYTETKGTLSFASNEGSRQVSVPIVGDIVHEPDETFTLTLSNPSGGGIDDGTAVGTIENDDALPALSVVSTSVLEGDSGTRDATFRVRSNRLSSRSVTFAYRTEDGTATAPRDYTARSGNATIPAGSTSVDVNVPVVGDRSVDGNEAFSLVITSANNATIADGTGVATIVEEWAEGQGYYFLASDGGVFPAGVAPGHGSAGGQRLNQPMVAMATTPNLGGYWLVATDGGVWPYGDAAGYGSTGNIRLNQPIVAIAANPNGKGYFLVARDGGVFPFGQVGFCASRAATGVSAPIVAAASSPDGKGCWMVGTDGRVYASGSAQHHGQITFPLAQPIVDMAVMPDGSGYWLIGRDGGVFPFGAAGAHGTLGDRRLNQPVVSIETTPTGKGIWIGAADGGIWPFGDAAGLRSLGGMRLNQPIVRVVASQPLYD